MRKTLFLTSIGIFLVAGGTAPAATGPAPLALVYRGPGTCWKGCAAAAAHVARLAGYRVRYVGAAEFDEADFREARLWVQPGGRAIEQTAAMVPALKERVRSFVQAGGGYVGFCAGAFLAARQFGWEEKNGERVTAPGLGLFPLNSRFYYREKRTAALLPFRFADGHMEKFYWELGPYIDARQAAPGVEFLSFYAGDEPYYAAAARGFFGAGRVTVSGFHPEAPPLWRRIFGLGDPEGPAYHYALEMIRWAGDARR